MPLRRPAIQDMSLFTLIHGEDISAIMTMTIILADSWMKYYIFFICLFICRFMKKILIL